MLIFGLIMLNSIWRGRYEKLDFETQDKILSFFSIIESGVLWTALCFWARTHV